MITATEHNPPYKWAFKPDTTALVREAEVWAEVEAAKGRPCESIDLLLAYRTYCGRQELRRRTPEGFCSWCAVHLRKTTVTGDRWETPLLGKVLTRHNGR